LITKSMNTGGSGVLQAAIFSALGYLWNSTITLLVYLLSERAVQDLALGSDFSRNALDLLESAVTFFSRHQCNSFAEVAATKLKQFLNKFTAQPVQPLLESTFDQQLQSMQDISFDGPDEMFDSFNMLDDLLNGFDQGDQDASEASWRQEWHHTQYDVSSWVNDNNESYNFNVAQR
jgi:hypothetical protein